MSEVSGPAELLDMLSISNAERRPSVKYLYEDARRKTRGALVKVASRLLKHLANIAAPNGPSVS